LNQLDHNVYVRGSGTAKYPVILWSPATADSCQAGFDSMESMRKMYPAFSKESMYYAQYDGPMFKGSQAGDYAVLAAFPAAKSGTELPPEIKKLLPLSWKEDGYVGAYPTVR